MGEDIEEKEKQKKSNVILSDLVKLRLKIYFLRAGEMFTHSRISQKLIMPLS